MVLMGWDSNLLYHLGGEGPLPEWVVLIKGLPMFPEGGQVGCKPPCRLITPRLLQPLSPHPQLPKDEPEGERAPVP